MKLQEISSAIDTICLTIPNTLFLRATDLQANVSADNIDLAGKIIVLFNNLPSTDFTISKSGYTEGAMSLDIKVLKLATLDDLETESDLLRDECAAIAHAVVQRLAPLSENITSYSISYLGETKVYDKTLTGCLLVFDFDVEAEHNCVITFSPEYTAILTYAKTAGYVLPSLLVQIRQNKLVEDLIASGNWQQLDTLHIFKGDGSEQFANLNWISPANNRIDKIGVVPYVLMKGYDLPGTLTDYLRLAGIPNTFAKYTKTKAFTAIGSPSDTWEAGAVTALSVNASILYRLNNIVNFILNGVNDPTSQYPGPKAEAYAGVKTIAGQRDIYVSNLPGVANSATFTEQDRPNVQFYIGAINRTNIPVSVGTVEHTVTMYAVGGEVNAPKFLEDFYNYVSNI